MVETDFEIRRALLTDIDDVLAVLDDAASWLKRLGVQQWPAAFERAWITPDIEAGNAWVVLDGETVVGTVTTTRTDPLWPSGSEPVIYLHRLAVRRSASGLGASVLGWVEDRAIDIGATAIRLDCVATNLRLKSYYEEAGFEHMADAVVGGPPGSRDGESGVTTAVSLYERKLGAVRLLGGAQRRARRSVRTAESEPIPEIDRLMAEAWPAAVTERCGPWIFRYTSGVTRRANSVLVAGDLDDLSHAVERARAFYRAHEAEPVFLVSEAMVSDQTVASLEALGYSGQAATWMLVGPTRSMIDSAGVPSALRLTVHDEPTDDWFGVYWANEVQRHDSQTARVMRDQLLRPDAPARYVTAYEAGEPISVGQVVLADGWACLQCLVTAPSGRRRGAAAAVFRTLGVEAEKAGVRSAFAAVMANNGPSLALCARAGLRPSHRYQYFA